MRKRRTKAETATLESQIYAVCEEDHPVPVRNVFYRMTETNLPVFVPKTGKGCNQVQARMSKMREEYRLPYRWVSDSTRTCLSGLEYASPEDFVRSMADIYKHDLWGGIDHKVEVWCESRSIASMIVGLCKEYAVSLYPCGGFPSKTFCYEAAICYSKPVSIIYIGDYDPAGVLIDATIMRELRKHTNVEIDFKRIAITPEQIAEYNLPTKPRKESEKRSQHVTVAVEAESMRAGVMRGLLEDEIKSHLTEEKIAYSKLMTEQGREYLSAFTTKKHKESKAAERGA